MAKQQKNIQYQFYYADIETYSPGGTPQFWYGCINASESDDYKIYTDFESFFKALTTLVENRRKVVVFHNSSYDISIIQYEACKRYGYQYNPRNKGLSKAIYEGLHTELYTTNTTNPIFIIDSRNLITGSLDGWGDKLGLPKGETPIVDAYRPVTDTDKEYVKRDVEILKSAFKLMDCEEAVKHGLLTVSSRTQSDLKQTVATIKGTSQRQNHLAQKYGVSANARRNEEVPIPVAIESQIESDIRAIKDKEYKTSSTHERRLYGLNESCVNDIRNKMKRYWLKRYTETYQDFNKAQKYIKKLLKQDTRTKVEKQDISDFFDLPLPDETKGKPNAEKMIEDYHLNRIIAGMNGHIAPAMRGGMTYVNPRYVNKEVGKGGVLDVNSLYPYILSAYEIPYRYIGSTKDIEPLYDRYYIAVVKRLRATAKANKHPFLKRGTKFTKDKNYLREIDWEIDYKKGIPDTVLCSVDIEYMYEVYDVHEIEYGEVFYFEADKDFTKGVRKHINYWRNKKEKAKDPATRQQAKFMLNTLWGRWGMYQKTVDDAGQKVEIGDEDTNYVSAIFTTAYARVYLNKAMNWFNKQLLYTDTDSVHFVYGGKVPNKKTLLSKLKNEIDPKVFGKWDLEKEFTKARYLKAKTYALEMNNGSIKATTAGSNLSLESLDDFYIGATFKTKKNFRDFKNRIVIQETTFTL